VFLAVRRQDWGRAPRSGLHLAPAVQDLSVVLVGRGETPPPNFVVLDKALNTRSFATKTCLAIRRGAPVGLCDLPWKPQVCDRYPRTDAQTDAHGAEPIPEALLAMFAFPEGLRLRSGQNPPPLALFQFAMVGAGAAAGQKSYATCCTFYEKLTVGHGQAGIAAVNGCRVRTGSPDDGGPADAILWAPKCAMLVSHWPFLRAWRRWLGDLVCAATALPPPAALSPRRHSGSGHRPLVSGSDSSRGRSTSTSTSTSGSSSRSFRTSNSSGGGDDVGCRPEPWAPEPWLAQLFHATPLPWAPEPFSLDNRGLPVGLRLPTRRRSPPGQPTSAAALGPAAGAESLARLAPAGSPGAAASGSVAWLRASPACGLPLLDLSLKPLFRCLSVDHVLDVLANLLLERKVGRRVQKHHNSNKALGTNTSAHCTP
jgi:hypothetical protein